MKAHLSVAGIKSWCFIMQLLGVCLLLPSLLWAYTTETESNNDFGLADTLSFPQAVGRGDVNPMTDDDYWVMTGVLQNDLIFAYVDTSQAAQRDSYLYLYSTLLALIELDDDDGPSYSSVVAGAVAPVNGNVFSLVRSYNNYYVIQPYYLFWSIVHPADLIPETEPNNSAPTAMAILPDVAVNGSVGTADEDFYSFTAQTGSRVSVILDNDPNNDFNLVQSRLQILGQDGSTELATGGNSTAEANAAGQVIISAGGTYFVRVTNLGGGGGDTAYRFVITGDINPYYTPTISPTATETPTITATPSQSPTRTITDTSTISPTATETPTVTATPSITETWTISPTATETPTVTTTPSSTGTATVSPTATETPTVTTTPSITGTWTISPTATETLTVTTTPSITGTSTISPTRTVSPTATITIDPFISAVPLNYAHDLGYEEVNPAGNVDYWVMDGVSAGDRIYSYVDTSGSSLRNSILNTYNDAQALIETDDNDGPGLSSAVAGATAPLTGKVYASVGSYLGAYVIQPYYLFLSMIGPGWTLPENEPNDSMFLMQMIVPNAEISGSAGLGDLDYYYFLANPGERFCVIMDNDPDNDDNVVQSNLRILSSTGTTIASGDNLVSHANAAGSVQSPAAGLYFIRVTNDGGGGGDTAYTFVVALQAGPPTAAPTATRTATHTRTPTGTRTPVILPTPTQTPTTPSYWLLPTGSLKIYNNLITTASHQAQSVIRWNQPETAETTIKIFDINGHLVKTLIDNELRAGQTTQVAVWDGKKASGRNAASGIYLVLVKAGHWEARGKIAIIRYD